MAGPNRRGRYEEFQPLQDFRHHAGATVFGRHRRQQLRQLQLLGLDPPVHLSEQRRERLDGSRQERLHGRLAVDRPGKRDLDDHRRGERVPGRIVHGLPEGGIVIGRRVLVGFLAAVAVLLLGTVAFGYFSATSATGGSGGSSADSVGTGAKPTTSQVGRCRIHSVSPARRAIRAKYLVLPHECARLNHGKRSSTAVSVWRPRPVTCPASPMIGEVRTRQRAWLVRTGG